jgi:hypothetical protein
MCVGLIDAFVLMLFLGPIDEDDDLDDDDDLPPGMGMMIMLPMIISCNL